MSVRGVGGAGALTGPRAAGGTVSGCEVIVVFGVQLNEPVTGFGLSVRRGQSLLKPEDLLVLKPHLFVLN